MENKRLLEHAQWIVTFFKRIDPEGEEVEAIIAEQIQKVINEEKASILNTHELSAVAEYILEDEDNNVYKCLHCEMEWVLMDGNPVENEMSFCPKCGLKIKYSNGI